MNENPEAVEQNVQEAEIASLQKVNENAQPKGAANTEQFKAASNSSINSIEDLRKLEPKVYKATLEGIARQIIGQMKRHQERISKLMKEGQRQS